jgi:formylglycine-generating enzyme required for sulfatase activity
MPGITRRDWIRSASSGLAACAIGASVPASTFSVDQRRRPGPHGPNPIVGVPAGVFLMGTSAQRIQTLATDYGYDLSWFDGELPERQVYLPAFAIQKYPVTQAEYAAFCFATGYPIPFNWPTGAPPAELYDHPVNCVDRADAQAYAAWIGMRLPTDAEWEKAARGVDGRNFPWGDAFDPDACHWSSDPTVPESGTAPVTAHPRGVSPYGVEDMVGNVGEWCANGPGAVTAFIKGGSWNSSEVVNLRPAARNMSGLTDYPCRFYGFRCVRSLP